MASAGIGTSGGSVGFGIKENNFLGIGVSLDSNILVDSDAIKGKFSVQILTLEIAINQFIYQLKL